MILNTFRKGEKLAKKNYKEVDKMNKNYKNIEQRHKEEEKSVKRTKTTH